MPLPLAINLFLLWRVWRSAAPFLNPWHKAALAIQSVPYLAWPGPSCVGLIFLDIAFGALWAVFGVHTEKAKDCQWIR